MARCRLAKNDSLSEALAINEAMGDIFKIGLIKIIFTVVLAFIMAFVLFIVSDSISDYNSVIGGIVLGVLSVYIIFFYNRATGLLYSNI